ncbi:MAG: hypothetical protein FWD66_08175 [Paludibacter sp.]|nr:hypothetical protein [Paludibacter sp.]
MFLLISALAWFLNALDKEQDATFRLPVSYIGIPKNILITDSLPEFLILNIRDNGRQIFKYQRNVNQPMTIDLSRTFYEKGEFSITADQLRGQIMRYMQPSTAIERIRPDTITVNYEKLSTAKVRVIPDFDIETASQHMLSAEPTVEPSEITVFAPKNILDTLQFIKTQKITLNDMKLSIDVKAMLKPEPSVRFSTDNVTLQVKVEMFTEKTLQIPITIINCPENILIKTFPSIVDVTFNVGADSYNKVKISDIQVIFDYRDIRSNDRGKISLHAQALAPYISNIQIKPSNVEFVIEKR